MGEHVPVLRVADFDVLLPEKPQEESARLQTVSARRTLDCARTVLRLALKIAVVAMLVRPSMSMANFKYPLVATKSPHPCERELLLL